MDKFIISIKKKYRERLLSREEQWPPVRGDKLINLELVETDKADGFQGDEKFKPSKNGEGSKKTKRTPIAYSDLFKAEDGKKPVRKIIVEGNGGMGKTTMCTMFSEGWAEEKLLKEFECVLLLPFREGKVSSAESLPDLFKLLHASEKIRSSVIDNLEEREGEGVLIIADGWDELVEVKRAKGSFLYNLLFDDVLPLASVLLTSRPSASAPLHSLSSVDRLVKVVGFNEENVKEYINSEFCKCPEKASSLIEQLDNNPLVLNVCSVPLNCAITCHLWHTLDQVFPSTLTELYTQIVQNIAFRSIKKKFPNTSLGLSLKSFDSIPKHLQKSFKLTCKFAFESLLKDKIVFSENELASFFPEVLDSNENFLCFGLLQSALSLLPVGQGLSFHFLHLTIQEFLAAFHFVTLPSEEQQKIFKKHAKSDRFANVWKFAFGLGSKTQGSSSGTVSRNVVCLEDKVVDGFVSALSGDRNQLFVSDKSDPLLLCHCAFESKDYAVTTKVARQIDGHFNSHRIVRTPHDCVAVYHVLRQTSHGSTVYIRLSGCGLGDKQLRELTDILFNGQLKVKELHLDDNKLNSKSASNLFDKASSSFSSLHQLTLNQNSIDGDCVNSIGASLMHMSCKSLTMLYLSDNPLGVSGIQALERAVQAGVLGNLCLLRLSNTLTSDKDINGALLVTFTKSIASHCPHLWELDLSRNSLGVPGSCAIGEALPLLTYGRREFDLHLSETMLNSKAMVAFSNGVVNNSKLISKELHTHSRVSLSLQTSSSPSAQFGKCILHLINNPLGSDGALTIFRMLKSETCQISKLHLDNTDLTTTDSQCQTIQHTNTGELLNLGPVVENSCLVYLDLDNNNFNGERVHLLVDFIRVCQALEHLSCRNSQLSLVDLLHLLISSSSSSSNLEVWYLSGNSLHDDEINALIASVPDLFPNLEKVSVYDNPVSVEVKKSLEKCLKRNKKGIETYSRAWYARRERQEAEKKAKLAKERSERKARRCLMLTEWERTCSPPQSEEEPTDCPPVKKMKVSVSPPTRPTCKHQHDDNTDSNCQSPPLKNGRLSPDCSVSGGLMSTDTCPTVESTHKQQGAEKCYLKYPTDFNSIYNDLWPVRAKWNDLGLSLGVLITTLDAIDKDNRGDCGVCLKNTLQSWMSTATQRPMEDLLKALSAPSVDFSELAKTLREKYCSAVHGSSSSNLDEWDLSGNSLDDDETNASVPDLFPYLEEVNLRNNPVSEEVKKRLDKYLESNTKGYSFAWYANRDRKEVERRAELAKERSERKAKLAKERSEREAKLAKERKARRCLVLTEWERTCSPPQSEELLSEFLRMWDELLWDMCYFSHVIVRYPGLYGLTTEVKGQDESQSLEMSDQPTDSVESLLKDDQQTDSIEEPTDCPPVKKMRVSVSPPTRPTGKHQHDDNTDTNCQSPPLKKVRLSSDRFLETSSPPDGLTSSCCTVSRLDQQEEEKREEDYLKLDTDFQPIYEDVWDVQTKWWNLGLALGLKPDKLNAIGINNREKCEDCLRDVLLSWMSTSSRRTIEDLLKALSARSVGFSELAKTLREKYCRVPISN